MREWVFHQVYSFNLLMFISIVLVSSFLAKYNTSKEIKELKNSVYHHVEDIKNEIRFK